MEQVGIGANELQPSATDRKAESEKAQGAEKRDLSGGDRVTKVGYRGCDLTELVFPACFIRLHQGTHRVSINWRMEVFLDLEREN